LRSRDLGIKEDLKRRVQELVQPGTSAIMVIVRKVIPDRFVEALRPYGGTVLLPPTTQSSSS
jgi:uncharacterized membrane protein